MCHSHAKVLFIAIILFTGFAGSAQTGTTSSPLSMTENNPYSKYGLGELWNGNSTELQGMANITSAFSNPYEINSDNPASYSFLQRTTFEGAMMADSRYISSNNLSYSTGTTTIAYLKVGVPIGKKAGLSFGLTPYSRQYFNLLDTVNNSPIGMVERSYAGEGTLNYAYVGAAVQVAKGLSLGINLGYMFGNFRNITAVIPIDTLSTNRAYSTEYSNYTQVGGIYWKAGLQYQTKLPDSNFTLRIGGTLTLSQNLNEIFNPYQISVYNFGDTLVNDTSSNPGSQTGRIKMPMSYSLGIMLAKNNIWGIGIDYAATDWSNFSSSSDPSLNLGVGKKSYKASLGGEYSPEQTKIHKHYSKVTYRFGVYYGTDYLNIDNTQLPVYGVTFGGSLHFKATHFSWVNLHTSFDIGRLGVLQNNLSQQTYVRFTLGISFNDRWFIPRKYD